MALIRFNKIECFPSISHFGKTFCNTAVFLYPLRLIGIRQYLVLVDVTLTINLVVLMRHVYWSVC